MLLMIDNSGSRVAEWRVGKRFSLPKTVDAVDITAVCVDGMELEFLSSVIENLVYPKNYGPVWWYGADAKTVASILESYDALEKESDEFLRRKRKMESAKKRVGAAIDKVKGFTFT